MSFLKQFLLLVILIISVNANAAEKVISHEKQIKGGLLYNFLKYTSWPNYKNKTGSAIQVCVFGDDPFDGYLKTMKKRTVNRQKINVRNIYLIEDTDKCNLLFLNSNQKNKWPELAKQLSGKTVLTVSDFAGFAGLGGMIEFGVKDEHISIMLNMQPIIDSNLKVNERLLNLVTFTNNGKE